MAYVTVNDLEESIGKIELDQLADRDRDADAAKMANAVSTAIAAATSEIDGYLRVLYDLPFSAAPSILTNIAVDIAVYNLSGRHRTEATIEAYKNATRLLTRISKGEMKLPVKQIEPEPVSIQLNTPGRLFDRDKLQGY